MAIYAPTTNSADLLTHRIFSRRDQIQPQSNVLWRLERGVVRTLTLNDDGTKIGLGYWGAGDVIGQPLSGLNPYLIECLTSVEISILPSELWEQALDAMLVHIQQAEEILNIIHLKPVSLRLWQLLVWLAQKFGRDVEQGRLIDLPLTHQELAEATNMTRVTITRLLHQFELDGRLRRHHRQLVLVVLSENAQESMFSSSH